MLGGRAHRLTWKVEVWSISRSPRRPQKLTTMVVLVSEISTGRQVVADVVVSKYPWQIFPKIYAQVTLTVY